MKSTWDGRIPNGAVRQTAAQMALDELGDVVHTGDSMLAQSRDIAQKYRDACAVAVAELGGNMPRGIALPETMSYFELAQIAYYGPSKALTKKRQRVKWSHRTKDDNKRMWSKGMLVRDVNNDQTGRIDDTRRGSPINTMHRDLHTPMYLVYWPNTRTSVWMWRKELALAPEGTMLDTSVELVSVQFVEESSHADQSQIAG